MALFRCIALMLLFTVSLHAQATLEKFQLVEDGPKHPFTFEDMYELGRVSDPQISPDGESVLYVVTNYSLETNTSNSDI
ncbi:MAG: hypothetical protein KFF77_00760, partial [Bacteroidetes bacterium]|nr:hypothetical protein [Bacteroidota bacterium]